jgi:hypothetical protein
MDYNSGPVHRGQPADASLDEAVPWLQELRILGNRASGGRLFSACGDTGLRRAKSGNRGLPARRSKFTRDGLKPGRTPLLWHSDWGNSRAQYQHWLEN